jgi:hemerythrin
MSKIAFNPKFATGNETVDAEHKRLFELIEEFFDSLGSGKPAANSMHTLTDLVAYAKIHFVNEENLMRTHKYPQIAQHMALHNELATKAANLLQQYKEKKLTLSTETALFLNDWLVKHILEDDLTMIQWIHDNH